MNDLAFFFKEGWQHIISLNALDHQLFILALVAVYLIQDIKRILILVTAFTLGHSLTLALSVLHIIIINEKLVEFLIPVTIIITAISNFFVQHKQAKKISLNYIYAFFFGLIHGLGFASSIKFMLAKDQSISWSLLGFNIGLEAGQIIVVTIMLVLSYLIVNKAKMPQKWWVYMLSCIAIIFACKFAIEGIRLNTNFNN